MTRRNITLARRPTGRISERLVAKAVRTAVHLALDQVPTDQVLNRRTAWLVAEAMTAISQHRWRLTVLMTLAVAAGRPMA